MEEKKLISVIVPCYNEQDVLPMFYKEITKVTAEMQETYPETEFEYLFIDDGSKDRTLRTLRVMAKYDKRVRYISFSRNFGKEAGIYAGLQNANGDYCVVMDADLQHPPAFLPKMYEAVRTGLYDCATTRRVSREGESKIRSWFAKKFYKIMNMISQTEIVDGAQDFRFMTRQMVDAVLAMTEYNRFSKGIFSWVGFRVKYFEYENVERPIGTSKWSFWGLFRYSLEGIIGFSTAPLSVSAIIGLATCLLGVLMLIITVIKKLVVGEPVAGYPTLICTLLLFGGLQLFCTGILGLYLGKTYLEVKRRPVYLKRETEQDAERMLDLTEEMEAAAAAQAEAEAAQKAAEAEKAARKAAAEAEAAAKLEAAEKLKAESDAEFDALVESAFTEGEEAAEEIRAAEQVQAVDLFREEEPEYEELPVSAEDAEEAAAAEEARRLAEEEAARRAEEEARRAEEEAEAARAAKQAEIEARLKAAEEEAAARVRAAEEEAAARQRAAEQREAEAEAEPDAYEDAEEAVENDVTALFDEADADAAEPEEAAAEAERSETGVQKPKFEVKIDYSKNIYDDDEEYDDEEYDEDYDDEYDDEYDDDYDDYDDYDYDDDEDPGEVPPSLTVSVMNRIGDLWQRFKKKCGEWWEKLAAAREAALQEEAAAREAEEAESAETDDDFAEDFAEEFDEAFDDAEETEISGSEPDAGTDTRSSESGDDPDNDGDSTYRGAHF